MGTFVDSEGFSNIMMAMETTVSPDGVTYKLPTGTEGELAELKKSYEHLCKLRDEVISMGTLPPLSDWNVS